MEPVSLIPDNITEVLVKVVQFTDLRRGILNGNIRGMDTPGYIPRDLPVVEFAAMLHVAVSEHVQHHRLVFRDTTNMTFGDGGTMRIHPIADDHAIALLKTNPDEYLNLQINRLVENYLNGKVAEELIRQHSGTTCCLPNLDSGNVVAADMFPEDRSPRLDATE